MTDNDNHKKQMKALQTEQNKKISEAQDPGRGLILVHTGDGKGKSSSAFGVIARALGWGHKVGVVQFIKGKWVTGERQFFAKFPDQLDWHTMGDGFTWNTQDKERDIEAAQAAFARAIEMMQSDKYELIVLDEINIALRYEYLNIENVIDGLKSRSNKTSVILTGRDAKPDLCEYADLVSEMREIKHPFKAGIKAQRGIDF
ncbi:cob(I)yrinic acid a,c-diamide adenosyltransferase [Hirschia baltica]|uniref:Corrinoid adenosyltransferase n=1 Tax=Hirschia baltica (strain ATCC 49814 / DSM 5838 / IFAM 1418) TaxID=582402 RepID=C6XM03_HIRBI|nr:cob(I)yrinic acid a,c-diamide adenosyltransferase [Hirschia baltica]ACT59835.1 cob(I)alamin adenosyltransferase [Hirschia baltica ATCC 49814]